MKILVGFGYADGGSLAERLGLLGKSMEVEASTAREVFEYLRSQSPEAHELFQLRFSHVGLLNCWWIVFLNRGTPTARGIKSEADLDAPLKEGDRIRITSASAGG